MTAKNANENANDAKKVLIFNGSGRVRFPYPAPFLEEPAVVEIAGFSLYINGFRVFRRFII